MLHEKLVKTLKTTRQEEAMRYVANNDVVGLNNMMGLLEPTQLGYVIEAVCLTNDADAVQQMLDPVTARAWCYNNVLNHSDKAPAVFDWWVSQNLNLYRTITKLLSKALDDVDKEKTLQGLGTTWPQRYVYNQLQNNPDRWSDMTIDWVGSTGSKLRQAAEGLGWHAQLFSSMLYGTVIMFNQVASLIDKTPYPYSLACLVRYMQEQSEDVDMTTRQAEKMLLADLNGRSTYSAAANPRDVALAHAIAKSHCEPTFCFDFHPDVAPPSPKELMDMQSLWDIHLSLNCVSLLMDNLAHGRLDMTPTMAQDVTLPALEHTP